MGVGKKGLVSKSSKSVENKGSKSRKTPSDGVVRKNTASQILKNKKEAARRLIKTCNTAFLNTDYGLYKIRDIDNMTHSEVEDVIYFCNYFLTQGTLNGAGIPTGSVAEVLEKIKIYERPQDWEMFI